MNEVIQNMKERRSTRAFSDKSVEHDKLEQIVEAGLWAPSGSNHQSWHISVIENKEKALVLAKLVGKACSKPEGYNFYGAPDFVILSNVRDYTNGMPDCAAALENMLLAATALGVDSCWINQVREACDDPAVRAMLTQFGIPENHVVYGSIAMGYGSGKAKAPERKDGLVTYVK